MINEKIKQSIAILNEMNVDMWLTFIRESSTIPDPALELILGTHVTWPSALIITAQGKNIAIVGSLDAQNIKDHADYEVITYVDSIKEDLLKVIKRIDPEKIAVNFSQNDVTADGLTYSMYMMLGEYLSGTKYSDKLISSEKIIGALRGRKSLEEIKRIKMAIRETLLIFDQVTDFVKPGLSETDVQKFINKCMHEKGLIPAWDPEQCPAIFSGPDTAGAHAMPTERKIKPGHIMNIDFGVKKFGYASDLQRTWYFLRKEETDPPHEVLRGFETIRDAIKKAAEVLKPGVTGLEVDTAARKYIVDAGYEEFPHALGHQVGRKAHDGSTLLCPEWDRYKNLPYSRVEAGQVFTLEPRLTVEGYGIATIEEIVLVTDKGCNFLSVPQQELIVIQN